MSGGLCPVTGYSSCHVYRHICSTVRRQCSFCERGTNKSSKLSPMACVHYVSTTAMTKSPALLLQQINDVRCSMVILAPDFNAIAPVCPV